MTQVLLNNGDILSIKKDILKGIFLEEDLNESTIISLKLVDADDFKLFVKNYESFKEGKSLPFDVTIICINIALALQLYDIVDINKKLILQSLESSEYLNSLKPHKNRLLLELYELNNDISLEILSDLISYTIKNTKIEFASWDLSTVIKHELENNTKTTLTVYNRGILTNKIIKDYKIESVGIDINHKVN